MPPSEKRNPPTNLIDSSVPTDSPPAYENTILPTTNPWTADIPLTLPSQPSHSVPNNPPPIPIPSQNPVAALSRLATVPYSKYRIQDSKLSDDQTSTTTSSLDLTSGTDLRILQRNVTKFLNEQALLPPKPIMIVRGTHLGTAGPHAPAIVDFEMKFNLTSFLDLSPDSDDDAGEIVGAGATGRKRNTKLKVTRYQHGSSNGSPKHLNREERNMSALELWVKKFCEDKAENRSFTLTRSIPNLPTALLEGHIRTLLASTKYRGKLTVEFPVHYAEIIILRKSSNWFTNMLRLYPTKKYEVLSVEWPVIGTSQQQSQSGNAEGSSAEGHVSRAENHPPSSASSASENGAQSGDQSHRTGLPAVVAQAWWREWHASIWNAVLGGKKGWVTVEDWIEAKMGVREKERGKEWGIDYE